MMASVNDCQTIISESLEALAKSALACNVGVDEAGRGPVLGPMVYGIAASPVEKHDELVALGVADSKALTDDVRSAILARMNDAEDSASRTVAYVLRVLTPAHLSRSSLHWIVYSVPRYDHLRTLMFKEFAKSERKNQAKARSKSNLNTESHDTCMSLIQLLLDKGVNIKNVYVDTVGPPDKYQEKLQRRFAHLNITVAKKADSLYPIVSAASIAAKVTRDRMLEQWQFVEERNGYKIKVPEEKWGSGYPGDPLTKEFLETSLDAFFGYTSIVRFDWQTTKTILSDGRKCVQVTWEDDEGVVRSNKSKSLNAYFGKRNADGSAANNTPTMVARHAFFQDRYITTAAQLI